MTIKYFVFTVLLSGFIGTAAMAAEPTMPPLPPGAKVVTTPTGGSITFKDGSTFEQGPTTVEAKGPEAIVWFLEGSKQYTDVAKLFRPGDLKSFESFPTGGELTFTDGTKMSFVNGNMETTGGLSTHYLNLFDQYGRTHSAEAAQKAVPAPAPQAPAVAPAPQPAVIGAPVQAPAPVITGEPAHPLDLVSGTLKDKSYAGKNMQGSSLTSVELYNVNMNGADLSNSDFTSVTFHGGSFENVNVKGADFTSVKFLGTKITGTDFSDAELVSTDMSTAISR